MHDAVLLRFWSKVDVSVDGCWLWTRSLVDGYGQFSIGYKRIGAHRFAYQLAYGPIPKGMELDHICRNRHCVRPDHLEVVTTAENVLRGIGITAINARRVVCINSHPLSGDNLVAGSNGSRACRACRVERTRQWRQRQGAKSA